MKLVGGVLIGIVAAVAVSGCVYVGPSKEARQTARYEEYGPKFTAEEKTNMSLDEKLAIYNANVAIEQQLRCRTGEITGSHFRVFRCFTNDELIAQQNAAEEFMRGVRRGGAF
jgi:cytochrome c biogenesis protein ResB